MREIPYNHEPGKLPATLEKIPLFSRLDESSLDGILDHCSLVEFDAGDVIITQGDEGTEVFLLLKGSAQVTQDGKHVSMIRQPGELFGEMAVVHPQARSASVVAVDRMFCLKIDPTFVEDLSADEKNAFFLVFYRFLVEVLSERLAETSRRVVELESGHG